MPLFDKLQEPVFLKETSSAQRQLEQMQAVDRALLPMEMLSQLENDIKLVSLGLQGEKAIKYELRNSHMPMYILHDLYIEREGLAAQIDYLVVTRRRSYVIECKNLYGNIEINEKGDFIRTVYFGNHYQKEGIYSPVTQNRRHLDLVRLMHRDNKKNTLTKAIAGMLSKSFYRPVIVLANPKTVLNDRHAKESIKNQVIRADALISFIKQSNADSGLPDANDEEMLKQADFFLRAHIERSIDYTERFRASYIDNMTRRLCEAHSQRNEICPECGAAMVIRTAKKGNNIGKKFWGCSTFPDCYGKISIG